MEPAENSPRQLRRERQFPKDRAPKNLKASKKEKEGVRTSSRIISPPDLERFEAEDMQFSRQLREASELAADL